MKPEDFRQRFAEIRGRLELTWEKSRAVLVKSEALLAERRRRTERSDLSDVDVKSFTDPSRSARAN